MKNIAIIAFLFAVAFTACKKDDSTDPKVVIPTATKRFTGFTYENNYSDPVSIQYDAIGRVTVYDEGDDIQTNTYTGNELHITEYRRSENREVLNFKGTLNAQGNLISGTGISKYNLSSPELIELSFEYNAAGYLTRKTRTSNNGASEIVSYYTYANGNMASVKHYLNGVYDYGVDWEYDSSKLDKTGLSYNYAGGNTFTGKPNKNIATKYISNRPGTSGWFADFTYTFDKDGYALSNFTTISDGDTYKVLYKYE